MGERCFYLIILGAKSIQVQEGSEAEASIPQPVSRPEFL